jgi:hypothetical protein
MRKKEATMLRQYNASSSSLLLQHWTELRTTADFELLMQLKLVRDASEKNLHSFWKNQLPEHNEQQNLKLFSKIKN